MDLLSRSEIEERWGRWSFQTRINYISLMKFISRSRDYESDGIVPFDVRVSSAGVKALQVYVHTDILIEAYIRSFGAITNYKLKLGANDNVKPSTQMKGSVGNPICRVRVHWYWVHARKRNPLSDEFAKKNGGGLCPRGIKRAQRTVSIEFCGSCVRASLRLAPHFPSALRLFPACRRFAFFFFFFSFHHVGGVSLWCGDRRSWIETKGSKASYVNAR